LSKVDPSKVVFGASAFLLVFGLGFLSRHYETFPYPLVRAGIDAVRQVYAEKETITKTRPQELVTPAVNVEGEGVTRNVVAEAAPGLTLINSFFDDLNELRLVRNDGSVVHRWRTAFFEIFPNQDHIDPDRRPQSEWNLDTHGALILPDGSVVFNFEGLGTAKLDRCGVVQWTVPKLTHHSIEPSRDGGFWVSASIRVKDNSPYPVLKPPYFSDMLTKLSADGEVLEEIPLLDFFFENDLEALVLANRIPLAQEPTDDPLHLNDLEELDDEMARHFPQFSAGDLLLSLRNPNLLMVVDPSSKRVKWHQTGPWIGQHDPDFQPTGRISVFNNNTDGTPAGDILGGSQIVEVDPSTGRTEVVYGDLPGEHWSSMRRGKHQYLPNGNILVTDSESGRVFEVNRKRERVWEFVNRYDQQYVAVVRGATRYPEGYFTVTDWTCGASQESS
jgi:hypothetical protein